MVRVLVLLSELKMFCSVFLTSRIRPAVRNAPCVFWTRSRGRVQRVSFTVKEIKEIFVM